MDLARKLEDHVEVHALAVPPRGHLVVVSLQGRAPAVGSVGVREEVAPLGVVGVLRGPVVQVLHKHEPVLVEAGLRGLGVAARPELDVALVMRRDRELESHLGPCDELGLQRRTLNRLVVHVQLVRVLTRAVLGDAAVAALLPEVMPRRGVAVQAVRAVLYLRRRFAGRVASGHPRPAVLTSHPVSATRPVQVPVPLDPTRHGQHHEGRRRNRNEAARAPRSLCRAHGRARRLPAAPPQTPRQALPRAPPALPPFCGETLFAASPCPFSQPRTPRPQIP